MNSFMSWIGGKKALRDEIISRFPTDYKRYIEVSSGLCSEFSVNAYPHGKTVHILRSSEP